MRVVALLASYNEERFVAASIEHLIAHGIDVYLVDNESTDATVAIADRYQGRGVIGIETLPRGRCYAWERVLQRKSELAGTLDADWFIHADPDELRLPPVPRVSLAQALADVDRQGFNAVNFQEFTFVPTREEPDHDHARFGETMRSYYPFLPSFPHRLNAWKRQDVAVDLATYAGHRVDFGGLRMYPRSFPMRHYLFLSRAHAVSKYVERAYGTAELERGWHGGRATLEAGDIVLEPQAQLRHAGPGDVLDASSPRTEHPLFATDA